ncbi:hypothetical protein BLA3211_04868 [Burkholderia aenigmatica]|uniref:Uncharacterized protein n=1 Tax=Burkholderia aenigmatica TaxID=2015348 RepID=A0A6J5J9W6_9BURK|nr:hypothetical protein BLA3211_04868 [Burkholderia aenigmatica]
MRPTPHTRLRATGSPPRSPRLATRFRKASDPPTDATDASSNPVVDMFRPYLDHLAHN